MRYSNKTNSDNFAFFC